MSPNRLTTFTGETNIPIASVLNGEFDNVYKVFNAEIDGINSQLDDIYSGTVIRTGGSFGSATDVELTFGTSSEAYIVFSDANDCLAIGVDTTSRKLLICDKGDETTAFGYGNAADPSLIIHSKSTTAAEYLALYHNGSNGVINSGSGHLAIQSGGTNVAGFYSNALMITQKLQLSNSDVAHGVTDLLPTNVYGEFNLLNTDGAINITGIGESYYGLIVNSIVTSQDTGKSTGSIAPVIFVIGAKSGTSFGPMSANANIIVFRNYTSGTHIFDADGDSHQDVGTAWTNFDDEDDIQIVTDLSVHVSRPDDPIRARFQEFVKYNREALQKLKLVTFNEDGHHFVNNSQLLRLCIGALRQNAMRIAALEQRSGGVPLQIG